MLRPAALAVPLSTAGGAAAAASPTGQGRHAASGPGGRATWQGHSLANAIHRAAASAVAAGLGEPASAAPCQSGTCQSVEERQRRQRLQSDMHQRAAAAAATGRAYHAMLEQRERQRAAVAEEQERMRAVWASAAANTARPRHVPGPRPADASVGSSGGGSGSRRGPAGSGRPTSSTFHAAAATAAAPSVRAAPSSTRAAPPSNPASTTAGGSQAGQGPQLRDARFWMLYTLQWNRLYEDANGDDLWGQGFSAAAAAAKQQGGPASTTTGKVSSGFGMPADEYWREFVRESARGWRFQQAYGVPHGAQQGQQQQQQAQQQQGPRLGELPAVGAAAGGSSLEREVRAELARMLTAAGGDLLRFIAALGVAFEPAADRSAALRNARTAFLLRLHPDKLRQAGEREQLQGLLATQVFNSLWAAERGRA